MKSTKSWRWLGLVLGLGLALLPIIGMSCTSATDPWGPEARPKVLTSFAPLYCFALNVAGDDAAVKPLLTSRGPHDYSGDAKDMVWLQNADLFLVNGLSLDDDFASKLAHNSRNTRLRLAKVGEAAVPKSDRPQLNVEHGDHSHSGDDPHVWVGLPEAQKMVDQIAVELSAIDPAHKANYERRAKEYKDKLKKVHQDGLEELKAVSGDKRIVTTHDAFQYFARAMGVEIVGYIQPRAGHGIATKDLMELVEKCKGKVVRVITTEPQFPTKDAKALHDAVSSKLNNQPKPVMAELDPLETANEADLDAGWYERKMKQNVKNLVEAFQQYEKQK